MKKKYFVIILIMIFLVAGCKGGRKQTSISDIELQKGFDGLTIELLENAPPPNIFENSPFPVIIKLQNKGVRDIKEEGILAIGVEKDYVKLNLDVFEGSDKISSKPDEDKIIFSLNGKSLLNPIGEREIVELNLETKNVGAQSESRKSNVLVTACYEYATKLGTEVCVDTDIHNLKARQKACNAKDLTFSNGQGSPVTITKIETQMLPDIDNNKIKPHLIIHIKNKGNGEVIRPGSYDKVCSEKELDYKEFNLLSAKAFLSEKELECIMPREVEGEGSFIKLKDKEGIVRCTLEEGIDENDESYIAPLRIELSYGYTFTVSREFTIEKILEY